ncbi:hypothetical protein Micbo1qcDRAFT_167636, partial [Microdochium bolleyi]
MLQYSTIVHMRSSPAFNVMECLQFGTSPRWHRPADKGYQHRLIEHGMRKLRELHRARKFHPSEVYDGGMTLAWWLFYIIGNCCWTAMSLNEVLPLIDCLWHDCVAVIGIPPTQKAFHDGAPIARALRVDRSNLMAPVLRTLLPSTLQGSIHWGPSDDDGDYAQPLRVAFGSEWILAEVFDFSSLGDAILRNEGSVVAKLLAQNPQLVMEETIYGFPDHFVFCVATGLCLPEVIEGLKASEQGKLLLTHLLSSPTYQGDCISTFVLALCRTGRDSVVPGAAAGVQTQRCLQAAALSILCDEDDCVVWPHRANWIYKSPCRDCNDAFARGLLDRRRRLKNFAIA